ncbi:hypothetical protein [Campylobacter estrildidarum]|uniref:Uncharacterized protein n=1 Tax=Campylobacter estrildidarum TaxID=2510189 RepID=A0A4U7BSE7_9BACT|nr:hypothetical protein [Campylobacter estrildidarum]TKX31694.1 hypothetical protein CQA69_01310 [Campylobacter estrildidarum]
MDFLDSLKNIKKEMQANSHKASKKTSKDNTSANRLDKPTKDMQAKMQENTLDKEMQDIFLKQEKLQDEFSEFIKNSDIKKI